MADKIEVSSFELQNCASRYAESLQTLQEAVHDYTSALEALRQDWTGKAALIVMGNIVSLTSKIVKSFDRVNDAIKELNTAETMYDENEAKQQNKYNSIDVGVKSPFAG